MKRWALRVLVFLLLGAIVNIAVAWGCAIWSGRFSDVLLERDAPSFVRKAHAARNSLYGWRGWDVESGYRSLGFDVFRIRTLGTRDHHLQSTALVIGWPRPSLWGFHSYYLEADSWKRPLIEQMSSGVWIFGSEQGSWWWIPYWPLWPGFAINTLFYAVILWLLFGAPFALRRLRRRRRIRSDLCPACAYPVGESAVCTECGKQLPSPSR